MPIYAQKKKYEPAPVGLHPGVCVDVVDLGIQTTPWGEGVQIKIVWQLSERNKKGYRFLVSKKYTPSLHKKSKLRPELESWRGKAFTVEEEKKFDIEKLLGANCQLSITHKITDDATYANVAAVVPASKNQEKLFAEDYTREIERPEYVAPKQPEEELDPETNQDGIEDEDIPF